jgi:D-arabinose 1-dehydrogenase-like Zn-dependent alcohol dehydrogenase
MRALRFHGVDDLRLDDVEPPTLDGHEVIVRVEASGVCGSDLHFLDGTARTAFVPITLGHEIAGTIEESAVDGRAGNPVVVTTGAHCGECHPCRLHRPNLCVNMVVMGIDRDGGLAELVGVPSAMVMARPEQVSAPAAATAVDAGATALHAVERRGRVGDGDIVVVIGVGGLGSYGLQMARNLGAEVIAADIDHDALDRARSLGASATVLVEGQMSVGREVKRLTGGGADVALEFVGRASTVDAAVKCLRPGGRAVAVGVGTEPVTTLPPVLWSNNEYTLTGSYGSLPGDAERVLAGLAAGSLVPPPLSTEPLDTAAEAIMALARGDRTVTGRVVVLPGG